MFVVVIGKCLCVCFGYCYWYLLVGVGWENGRRVVKYDINQIEFVSRATRIVTLIVIVVIVIYNYVNMYQHNIYNHNN